MEYTGRGKELLLGFLVAMAVLVPIYLLHRYQVEAAANGTDPAPSLAEFERLVAARDIRYFIGTNQDSFGGGSGVATQIATWVKEHFRSRTVGGLTVYDLTRPLS